MYLDIKASSQSKCRRSCRLCARSPPPGRSHADSCTPGCSQNQTDPFPPRPHGARSLAAYRRGLQGGQGDSFRLTGTDSQDGWAMSLRDLCFLRMQSGCVPLHVRSGWQVLEEEPWIKWPGWHWKDTTLPTCTDRGGKSLSYFIESCGVLWPRGSICWPCNHNFPNLCPAGDLWGFYPPALLSALHGNSTKGNWNSFPKYTWQITSQYNDDIFEQ